MEEKLYNFRGKYIPLQYYPIKFIYNKVKYYKKQKKERYKQKIQLDIFPEGNTY